MRRPTRGATYFTASLVLGVFIPAGVVEASVGWGQDGAIGSASTSSAPAGVNPECGTLLAGSDHSLGNIANIIACALSMLFCAGLVVLAGQRKAAVGRTKLCIFLALYTLSLPFQLITTGSFLQQGGTPLVVITGIHAGIVATQVVEDGSASSIIPFTAISVVFLTYIALDTGMQFTHVFGPSSPLNELKSIPVFVLTSIWPAVNAPFIPCYSGVNAKIDGSFVATILETAAVGVLHLAWGVSPKNRGTTSTPYRKTISHGVEDLVFTQDRPPARGDTEKPTKK
ncbi:hypothetical protein FIBSPDRAFT_897560 [Athelia psychrophila]|uniref:Uncharacterized protein n=1 Tax=Athelia psychrophila TaxID=1759441 RepID=A0A166C5A8_9AGAM|nr:hypothetical protein FIBSPDRAFT_897560 [Fibularhizoctonia sp. CBS 109695]